MNKPAAILFAMILFTGCTGGGISGGAGGAGCVRTESGLLLCASLSVDGDSGVDAFNEPCLDSDTGERSGEEPGLSTKTGRFTVTIDNFADFTGVERLFPVGVNFNTYTVSFSPENNSAPSLTRRPERSQTFSLVNDESSESVPVILVDRDTTLGEFVENTPDDADAAVFSYSVTVTFSGKTLADKPVSLAASTFIEIGNFDRCD